MGKLIKTVMVGFIVLMCMRAAFAGDDCINIQSFPYSIVARIDPHHYGMVLVMGRTGKKLLLETKKAVFNTPGTPVGIGIKSAGYRQVASKSGFNSTVEIVKECSIIPYKTKVLYGPGLSFRERINGE